MERLNEYRIMWLFVFFDLPTETKEEKRAHAKFRKELMADGFSMFQYSIYVRHCASLENCDVHVNRVKRIIPEYGFVAIMRLTDKQFSMIETYYGCKEKPMPSTPQQLTLF